MMEKEKPRVGVYIWIQGSRLDQIIDLEGLVEKTGKQKIVGQVRVLSDLWSDNLVEMLQHDIQEQGVNRFLWIGRFGDHQVRIIREKSASLSVNPYLHYWFDLEEQGITSASVDIKIREKKALALIKMAVARTRLLEPLEPEKIPASDELLVIGAGVSGLHAADSVASLGKTVHVLERESGVGGNVAQLSRFYPRICDPHCGLEFILDRLVESKRVFLHTHSELVALSGSPGNFTAKFRKRPRYVNEARCNGCGECVHVCPVETIHAVPHSKVMLPEEDGSNVLRNLFQFKQKAIHPSRPMSFPAAYTIDRDRCPPGCEECVGACPSKAVDLEQKEIEAEIQAGAVLVTTGWEPYPLSEVEEYGYGRYPNVISNLEMERILAVEDKNESVLPGFSLGKLKQVGFIQCAGSRDERHLPYCSSVCCSVTLKQILHLSQILPDTRFFVFYMHIRSAGFEEELYRQTRESGNVVFIKDRPARVNHDPNTGRLNITVLDPALDKKLEFDLDLMVLSGGMCPSSESKKISELLNLPQNRFDFFESHQQCFPEETQRTGIFAGGCARQPQNVAQSIESSHQAAIKALPFLQGEITIEPTYPVLDKTKCDQCKRCMEDCPYSSFIFDEKEFPLPVLSTCRQCGNCMGVCPIVAISIRNNTIKQSAAQIQVLENSFMGPKEPIVLAFLCENDAYKAAQKAAYDGMEIPPNVVFLKVSCAGNVNNALLADALSLGIDGIFIGGCKDDHCHYVWGNQLVEKRSDDLSDKLKTMRIEPERIRFENIEIRDSKKYVDVMTAFVEDLKKMGPNPFKI